MSRGEFSLSLICLGLLAACGSEDDTQILSSTRQAVTTIGGPADDLTSTELAAFTTAQQAFATAEDVDEGLGPVFNDTACGNCHSQGAIGGAGTTTETRSGTVVNGTFDPLTQFGGSLIQVNGIGQISDCNYVGEVVPAQATVVAGRLTTPIFGGGLIDAVADSTLENLASRQRILSPGTAGKVNHVFDPTRNTTAAGRFGWKAQVASLLQFSGDAYLNEMGITSPTFPTENCPQGDCTLLRCDPVPDPEDDGTDVAEFRDFMQLLARPPTVALSSSASTGRILFQSFGCQNCHTGSLTTGSSPIAALNQVQFAPYSDFLVHDMGSLGDGIPQGEATGTQMRTAPLWGLRFRTRFLHDGRATTVSAAIAQWRKLQTDDRESMVKIRAKSAAAHFRWKIAVGRGDDPYVDVSEGFAADRFDFATLDGAEQPRCARGSSRAPRDRREFSFRQKMTPESSAVCGQIHD